MKLLLASNNSNKQREIQSIFDEMLPQEIELLIPSQILRQELIIEENGKDIYENAYLKATAFHSACSIPCIADDTGLFIDALGGAPGKDAAIFAGEHGNDRKNREKVLKMLSGVPTEKRCARFRTVIYFIAPDIIEYFEGTAEGIITFEEKGCSGFGYDPIFIPDGFDITFAEMDKKSKNRISHRFNAVRAFADFIKNNKPVWD